MDADLSLVLKIFQAIETRGFDFEGAVAAVKSEDPQQILALVEQVLQIAGDVGLPYASDARLGLILLGFIVKGYQTGLIRNGQPEDPAMMKAEGKKPSGFTPQLHSPVVIAPGGTETDPYNFDGRKTDVH